VSASRAQAIAPPSTVRACFRFERIRSDVQAPPLQIDKAKIREAYALMESCALCPRRCGVNRLKDERGFCGIGRTPLVSSAGPHFGEEPPLVGLGGSGTIFFAGCNLGCVFCQNYDISHYRRGQAADAHSIADMMLALEQRGCHNVNFVTPTHVAAHVIEAVAIARERGLRVPIVYNCGGYESLEVLKLLDGVVEVYMPDAKYADAEHARRYSRAEDYPAVMKAALKEMHRQVGDLTIRYGIATHGLLVRHLVMPNNVAGSKEIIDFLADEISPNTYVNVMAQYRPTFKAAEFDAINRTITDEEFFAAREYAAKRGLRLAR